VGEVLWHQQVQPKAQKLLSACAVIPNLTTFTGIATELEIELKKFRGT
jgi:hypothetical protein